MYDGPIREGNRGGAGDFRWSAVKDDKHRENYLGHSVQAPVGRWQKNSDIHWYTRDVETDADKLAAAKKEEIRRLKEAEEEALAVALGHAPKKKLDGDMVGIGSGANAVKVEGSRSEEIERLEREERKREKSLRKEQRALIRAEREVKKEERRRDRHEHRDRYDDRRDRSRSRERERRRDDKNHDRRDRHSVKREREVSFDRYEKKRDRSRDRSRNRDREDGGHHHSDKRDREDDTDIRGRRYSGSRSRTPVKREYDNRSRSRSPRR